jgi:beta-glucanase (GH16 family)
VVDNDDCLVGGAGLIVKGPNCIEQLIGAIVGVRADDYADFHLMESIGPQTQLNDTRGPAADATGRGLRRCRGRSGLARLAAALIAMSVVAACGGSGRHAPTASTAPQARSQGTHYRLVWQQQFDGPAGASPDPHVWTPVTGKPRTHNGELEVYTRRRSNYSLDGHGDLAITALRQGGGYTSAKIETLGAFQVQYGRIEADIKVPQGAGLWPAFWLLGSNYPHVGWPESGELDAMEVSGTKPNVVVGTVHGPLIARSQSSWQKNAVERTATPLGDGFHVYGIDWSPHEVIFTLDGAPYGEVTPASLRSSQRWVFDHPYFLVLDLAVGGRFPGPPTAATHFPATMLVRWVRVWKQA